MSFLGPSDAQKQAQGFFREQGTWNQKQYQEWLDKMKAAGANADALRGWATQYNLDRADQGLPSTSTIRGTGQDIMPGVDEALGRRTQRLQDTIDRYKSGVPQAADVTGAVTNANNEALAGIGGNVGGLYDTQQGEIGDTYGRGAGRFAGADTAIQGDIKGRYGALEGNTNATYGDLRGKSANMIARLQGSGEGLTLDQQKNLEMLRPGGEFRQGQVARAFAPNIAATSGRLRRLGIDPGSLQASGAISGVEADRARAMDDAQANSTTSYVDRANALKQQLQAQRERLAGQGFANEAGLAQTQTGITNQLGREQGGLYRGQVGDNAAQQTALDQMRQGQTMQNTQDYYNNANRFLQARQQAQQQQALMGRDLGQQDWGVNADLANAQNAEELTGLGLKNQQYQLGAGQTAADIALKNQAAQNLWGIGTQQYNMQLADANTARGFGQDASGNFTNTYNLEAPNAGWGKKLIGGIAAGAASAIPGVGPMVGGAIRGATGAPGGGGGAGGYTDWTQIYKKQPSTNWANSGMWGG